MRKLVMFSGFGGQGILSAGQLLAMAGLLEGLEVTWYPSYGAEMRGGTANCTVVISDQPIGSPVGDRADAVLAFNQPALEAFSGKVVPGGELIYNSSIAGTDSIRTDISVKAVAATKIADKLGEPRVVNMVMLGALLSSPGLVATDSLLKAVSQKIGAAKKKLLLINREALELGAKSYRASSG